MGFSLDNIEKTARAAAFAGALQLERHFGHLTCVRSKSIAGDLVTEADEASEKEILAVIRKDFPKHCVLSEESGWQEAENANALWVIDPLDGTTNYAHGYPIFAISIAFAFEGDVKVAVIYDPTRKELFSAIKNLGAYLNGTKIGVSNESRLEKSLLATGFPYDRKAKTGYDTNYPQFCNLTADSQGVRRGGAAALDLAYVAAGRLDGFWESGLKPWDMAAGALLVEEAKGQVTTYAGKKFRLDAPNILATNSHLHSFIATYLMP